MTKDTSAKTQEYLPISRKYRPQAFSEVVGQDHITTILTNSIKLQKVATSYIFSGARGVGKTTTARILVKALNCPNAKEAVACNECDSCNEIAKGINLDVLEIDGASNRGIDEIRNLRENVKLKPVSGKYRIYIIDEVHMLTSEAFNALLKTLEEPPAHVKFIFATTAPHKILPTILSRCQRFDFKLISSDKIIGQLKKVSESEKINIDEDALLLIAKKGDGSMRDAEVILDQIASFTKGKIKLKDVADMLGVLEHEILVRISDALKAQDSTTLIEMLNILINNGKAPLFIANALIEHFRNVLVMSSLKETSEYIIMSEEDKKDIKRLSQEFTQDEIFYIIQSLQNTAELISRTSLGKIPLETVLLKIARQKQLMPLEDILSSINKLEYLASKAPVIPQISSRGEVFSPETNSTEPKVNETAAKEQEPKPTTEAYLQGEQLKSFFASIKASWLDIIEAIKINKISTGMFLSEGRLTGIKDNSILVCFAKEKSMQKETLQQSNSIDIIEKALVEITGKKLRICFEFFNDEEEKAQPKINVAQEIPKRSSKKIDPHIVSAIDKFGGRIVGQYYLRDEKPGEEDATE